MPVKRLVTIAALAIGCAAAHSQVPLTSIHAVRLLSNEEANLGLPVAFEATVTYFRSYESTLFVQDGGYVMVTMDNPDSARLMGWLDAEAEILRTDAVTER